jgi:hypothetical protein
MTERIRMNYIKNDQFPRSVLLYPPDTNPQGYNHDYVESGRLETRWNTRSIGEETKIIRSS